MLDDVKVIKVFMGSPGELTEEYLRVEHFFSQFNCLNCSTKHVFVLVFWKYLNRGADKPQTIINSEIDSCDYAIFIFGHTVGNSDGQIDSKTIGEFHRCMNLKSEKKIKDVIVFFKKIKKEQLEDPGERLKKVLAFKKEIEEKNTNFYYTYENLDALEKDLGNKFHGLIHAQNYSERQIETVNDKSELPE